MIHIETDSCPSCASHIDAATAVDGTDVQPTPGDISLCFVCGAVLIFDGNLKHALAEQSVIDQLDDDTKRTVTELSARLSYAYLARGRN